MKISIITINYNNCDGLRKTIESVINQTWQDFEYIIIDGGSTDGSAEVIKEYAGHIDYWCSEPDKGIYDAMNKGIRKASGEYCLFMNSADVIYQPTTLENVLNKLDGTDIISGKLLFEQGNIMVPPKEITAKFFFICTLPHQATFIRRELFDNHLYDTDYRIVSDWKFWIEVLVFDNCSYATIDTIIALFDCSGISSTNEPLRIHEQQDVLSKLYLPRIKSDYQTLLYGDTYEDKMYLMIKGHKFHKLFYILNLTIIKVYSLINKKTSWVKEFPFNI
jgi:glycosyltransferase involved in cell wall biosynthesis